MRPCPNVLVRVVIRGTNRVETAPTVSSTPANHFDSQPHPVPISWGAILERATPIGFELASRLRCTRPLRATSRPRPHPARRVASGPTMDRPFALLATIGATPGETE